MQGRLSNKSPERLQSFPKKTWKEEFYRARDIGFDTIEWLLDDYRETNNPILSETGRREISQLVTDSGVSVQSVCAHAFIDGSLLREDRDALDSLVALTFACRCLGVERIVLPVLERSEIQDEETWKALFEVLKTVREYCLTHDISIALESDLDAEILASWISDFPTTEVTTCYDVGNAVGRHADPIHELEILSDLISEIHIKDKTRAGISHSLGQGDVNFIALFEWLKNADHNIPLVFETPVFDDWKREGSQNYQFIKQLMTPELLL